MSALASGPPGDDRPGLYVHVPFCARACPYCDFDFEVGRTPPVERFLGGLAREWSARQREWEGRAFASVYIGGGTPSALGVEGLRALVAWIRGALPLGELEEWTVEVNPEHCDERLAGTLVDLGVSRISLGVQSFADAGLRTLGRVHDGDTAARALRAVAATGARACADLIVGWPGETLPVACADVQRCADLGASHLSVYALTIEPDTPWAKLVARGLRALPDDDAQADLLAAARLAAIEQGFDHYEVANFCRPGHESRHNSRYWSWCDYLGLGPSAHSARYFATGEVARRGNLRGFARWSASPADAESQERLVAVEAAREGLWTGLRRLRGFEVSRFVRRFGVDEGWLRDVTKRQVALGNLEWTGDVMRVVRDRWLWHDGIAADLLG